MGKLILKGLVRAYQLCISPLMGPSCRFTPSCSNYALLALKKHPFFKALYLITKRLLKCGPWHPGGPDAP